MMRYDLDDDVSDEDYETKLEPCLDKINQYIKDHIVNEFVAMDIATFYEMDVMWEEPLESIIGGALDDLAQVTNDFCDIEKIKQILEKEYHLKITNENPINIEEL